MPLFYQRERYLLQICKNCNELGKSNLKSGIEGCMYFIGSIYDPTDDGDRPDSSWMAVVEGCPKFLEHMMRGKGLLYDDKGKKVE